MFLSKASVVLVCILGTSWFTGDTFVSAGPLPQGYNQQMPQGYNQQMPQGYNQLMPQGYNQQIPQGYNQQMPQGYYQQMPQGYNQQMPQGNNELMPQGYNQQMPQYQPPNTVYVNSNPPSVAPIYQPQPQVIYVTAPAPNNYASLEIRPPVIRVIDSATDWGENILQGLLGQKPLPEARTHNGGR